MPDYTQTIFVSLVSIIGGGGLVKILDLILKHQRGGPELVIDKLEKIIERDRKEYEKRERRNDRYRAEAESRMRELEEDLAEVRGTCEEHIADNIKLRVLNTKLRSIVKACQPNLIPDSDDPSPASGRSEYY